MLRGNISNSLRCIIRNSPMAPMLRKYFRRSQIEDVLEVGREQGWSHAAYWILNGPGSHYLQSGQFHNIFRRGINTNIEYEFLLTEIRKFFLLSGFSNIQDPGKIRLISTIIIQAHYNEFVWYVSDEEKDRVNSIVKSLQCEDQDESDNSANLILLAMYSRIGQINGLSYERHCLLLQEMKRLLPESYEIVSGYIAEHDELLAIKVDIKQIKSIENQASIAIAKNYEEYPYPRWIDWDFPEPGKRIDKLQEFFAFDELSFSSRPFNVLVAGCGTGSKAIEYAIGYGEKAKIFAVDLSRTSLSYAIYMSKKLNIRNIEFMQMDLLDLPSLEMTFDIVECTGVLHHMQDPMKGGEAIIARVRNSGLVHISLYSELARRSIVELREKYALKPNMGNDEIRYKRMQMMKNDTQLIDEGLSLRWDFFDLNRCKDLLFHPLEHRFTIPKIKAMLTELNLEFRGIERPDIIRSELWTHYPAKNEIRNFQKWHEFEVRHPDAFGNLYEIWALK